MDTPVVDLTVSSSPSAATPPLPARQRDLPLALRTAIDSADNRTLRNIVATCAERDPAARTLVTAILRQDGRVRQREEDWAICEHCNKPFDASDGADRDADAEELCEDNQLDEESFECRWHPGA